MVNFKDNDFFINKINQSLSNYDYNLKLGEVVLYNSQDPKLHITFIFNEESFSYLTKNIKDSILKVSKNILPQNVKVEISYRRVEYSNINLIKKIQEFFKYNAEIQHRTINYSNIKFEEENNKIVVKLELASFTYRYVKYNNLDKSIISFLNMYFYENIVVEFIENSTLNTNCMKNIVVAPTYTSFQSINIKFTKHISGKRIFKNPYTIRDSISEIGEIITICGLISRIELINTKEKQFYKFSLDDTTGSISCLFFLNEARKKALADGALKDGVEIIVQGPLKTDRINGLPLLLVNSVALCDIDYNTIPIQTFVKDVNRDYKLIFPKPYLRETSQQLSFFNETQPIFKELEGEVVIFDLETTGTNVNTAKIIEVGAVKLVNGIFESTFSTFVNPLMKIPLDASEINNIYDEDVKDAPKIEEILPDLYKYVCNAKLVAHNIDYDINVLNNNALKFLYRFENDLVCTLELAKSQPNLKVSNYKLLTLTKRFNIDLKTAHRALDDAIATAQVYLELLKVKYGR